MLLCVTGMGCVVRHPWISPGKGIKKNKVEEIILEYYPDLRDDELELFMKLNTKEDIEQFLKDNGLDDKSIKDIFKIDSKK